MPEPTMPRRTDLLVFGVVMVLTLVGAALIMRPSSPPAPVVSVQSPVVNMATTNNPLVVLPPYTIENLAWSFDQQDPQRQINFRFDIRNNMGSSTNFWIAVEFMDGVWKTNLTTTHFMVKLAGYGDELFVGKAFSFQNEAYLTESMRVQAGEP